MIRHVVFLKLRNAADAPQIFSALKTLQFQVPDLGSILFGQDRRQEGFSLV
jgi:hypothetical protein